MENKSKILRGFTVPVLNLLQDTDEIGGSQKKGQKQNVIHNLYNAFFEAQRGFKIHNHIFKNLVNKHFIQNTETLRKQKISFFYWAKIKHAFRFCFYIKSQLQNKKLNGIAFQFNNNEKNNQYIYSSLSGHLDKMIQVKVRKWYIIYPDSKFNTFWILVNLFMFAYVSFYLPFKIAFIEDDNVYEYIVDVMINILFLMDMGFSFFTAYYENGKIVHEIKKIMSLYLRGWFAFDLVSTFPFDYLIDIQDSLVFFTKFSKVLKILKLVRLARISDTFKKNKLTSKFFSYIKVGRQFGEFFTFSMIIILLTHITGCFWFFLTRLQSQQNWLIISASKFTLPADNSYIEQYFLSFYWAISTICTVGFGDVVPQTPLEKIFNIIWIMVGVAFYSYTVGTLTTILNNQNKKKGKFSSRFAFLHQLSKEINFDKSLLENITINLEYLEESNKYHSNHMNSNILEDVSLELTYKIAKHIYSDLINKVTIFKEQDIHFISQLTPFLQARKFYPGELIYKIQEYPSFVYFIIQGKIGFFSNSSIMIRTFVEGSYFGEIEIFKSNSRQFDTRTLEETSLLLLPRDVFLNILENFPEINEQMHYIAIERDIILKQSFYQLEKQLLLNNAAHILNKNQNEIILNQQNLMHQNILNLKSNILKNYQSQQKNSLKISNMFQKNLTISKMGSMMSSQSNNEESMISQQQEIEIENLKENFDKMQILCKKMNSLSFLILTRFLNNEVVINQRALKKNKGVNHNAENLLNNVKIDFIFDNFQDNYLTQKLIFEEVQNNNLECKETPQKLYPTFSIDIKNQKEEDVENNKLVIKNIQLKKQDLFGTEEFKNYLSDFCKKYKEIKLQKDQSYSMISNRENEDSNFQTIINFKNNAAQNIRQKKTENSFSNAWSVKTQQFRKNKKRRLVYNKQSF